MIEKLENTIYSQRYLTNKLAYYEAKELEIQSLTGLNMSELVEKLKNGWKLSDPNNFEESRNKAVNETLPKYSNYFGKMIL